MDALDLIETLDAVDFENIASDILGNSRESVLEKNREQMLEGKLSTGADITPSYFDDPYFKTKEAAQRYSDWKDRITPNRNRKSGTPNLFITGEFHRSIDFSVTGDEFVFRSSFYKSGAIEAKFSDDIYWLNDEKKEELIEQNLRTPWQLQIETLTGLTFG